MRVAASLRENGNVWVPAWRKGKSPGSSGGYEVRPDDPYYRKALLMLPRGERRRAAAIVAARREPSG